MKTMLDLQVGDEIQAYLRQSMPLEVGRRPDGSAYRYVPGRPQKASSSGISRFNGTVVANDATNRIITLNTVGINSRRNPISTSPGLPAEIHYSTFHRVFQFSAINFEPREEIRRGGNYYRPTTAGIGTNYKPYRTLTAIHIPQ